MPLYPYLYFINRDLKYKKLVLTNKLRSISNSGNFSCIFSYVTACQFACLCVLSGRTYRAGALCDAASRSQSSVEAR